MNFWYESLDFAQQQRFDVLRFSKEFQAHDRSHRQSDEIYAETERMANDLREAGHQFDSSWVTRPLQPDETIETVLCGHSERLALAFHFIQKPTPTFIQLTKNLRICGDCRMQCLSKSTERLTDCSRSSNETLGQDSSSGDRCERCQSYSSLRQGWTVLVSRSFLVLFFLLEINDADQMPVSFANGYWYPLFKQNKVDPMAFRFYSELKTSGLTSRYGFL